MIFRVRYRLAGGHVHCRLFAGRQEGALGKCGDLTMRDEEFRRFMRVRGIEFEPEADADRLAPWDGNLYPGPEETAAYCIEPMISLADGAESSLRIVVALQDAFELGVRTAGGSIFVGTDGTLQPDGPTETEKRKGAKS